MIIRLYRWSRFVLRLDMGTKAFKEVLTDLPSWDLDLVFLSGGFQIYCWLFRICFGYVEHDEYWEYNHPLFPPSVVFCTEVQKMQLNKCVIKVGSLQRCLAAASQAQKKRCNSCDRNSFLMWESLEYRLFNSMNTKKYCGYFDLNYFLLP